MRLVFLSPTTTLFLDIAAWAVFQILVAALAGLIPLQALDPQSWYFRSHPWEKDGEIYQRLLRIRDWKKHIPSWAGFFGGRAFRLDQVKKRDRDFLDRWARETCRAEVCHLAAILPSILFFLWNEPLAGWCMVVYALIFNLPLVFIQRSNRPWVRTLLEQQIDQDGKLAISNSRTNQ
jgi:glycosyl-4,4'-diaponeurosporenoate acyltransferase